MSFLTSNLFRREAENVEVELMQLSVVEITFNIRERPPKEAKIQGDGCNFFHGKVMAVWFSELQSMMVWWNVAWILMRLDGCWKILNRCFNVLADGSGCWQTWMLCPGAHVSFAQDDFWDARDNRGSVSPDISWDLFSLFVTLRLNKLAESGQSAVSFWCTLSMGEKLKCSIAVSEYPSEKTLSALELPTLRKLPRTTSVRWGMAAQHLIRNSKKTAKDAA